MSIKRRDTAVSFEVDITIQANTLLVGTTGGNVLGKPGDRVLWRTDPAGPPFTLEFFQIASEPSVAETDDACIEIDVAGLPRWPFTEPAEPKGGVIGPTHQFVGILGDNEETTFKYYVTVGNLRLDPIIIIDRK
jgi:hypothetical protein